MKKFFLFALFSLLAWSAVSYRSLHQYQDLNGYRTFKDQILQNRTSFTLQTPQLYYYPGYRIYPCQSGHNNCNNWCAKDWMRYRLYIPTQILDTLTLRFTAYANSSHYIMFYFVPDNSFLKNVNFNTYKEAERVSGWNVIDDGPMLIFTYPYQSVLYKMRDVKKIVLKNLTQYTQKSGWLYITIAQADQVMDSWNGYRENPKLVITAKYTLRSNIDKVNYLRTKRFTSTGDPVENFATLTENSKLCSGSVVQVRGQNVGEYIFDPNKPTLLSNVSKSTDGLDYDIEVKAGNAPLEGIAIGDNHNITLSMTLDSCLRVKNTITSKGTPFYSIDGQNWTKNFDPDTTYRFIKVEAASPDSSSVVLSPQESLQWKVQTLIDPNCLRTTLTSSWQARYILEGSEESIAKTLSYTFPVTTTSSSSSSSTYYYVASSTSSSTDPNQDTPQKCAARGGTWLDSLGCSIPPSGSAPAVTSSMSSSSSSSFSSSSSSEANQDGEEDTPEKCAARGGTWLDSLGCNKPPSSSSSSVVSSSSSVSVQEESRAINQDEYKARLAKELEEKSYDIKGYYIKVDGLDDVSRFSWVYVSASKNYVAKIEKPDNLEYYNWTTLQDLYHQVQAFDDVTIENGKVSFGKSLVPFTPGKDEYKARLAKELEEKSYDIKGYYIKVDGLDDVSRFSWVYVSASKNYVAKIEKPDNLEYYNWTTLQDLYHQVQAFDDVTIENGKVSFGKSLVPFIQETDNVNSTLSDVSSSNSSSQSSISRSSSESSSSDSSSVSSSISSQGSGVNSLPDLG